MITLTIIIIIQEFYKAPTLSLKALTLCGSLLQTVGPWYAKVRWPVDIVLTDWIWNSVREGTKLSGRKYCFNIVLSPLSWIFSFSFLFFSPQVIQDFRSEMQSWIVAIICWRSDIWPDVCNCVSSAKLSCNKEWWSTTADTFGIQDK